MRLSLRYRLLLPLALLLAGDVAATAWAASAAARGAERRLAAQQWAVARTLTEPDTPAPADVPTADPVEEGEEHQLGPPVTVAGQEYRCLRLPLKAPHPNAGGNLYIFYPESLRRTAVWDAARPLLLLGGLGG